VTGAVPQVLVYEKKDSLHVEVETIKTTIRELEKSTTSIDEDRMTRPIFRTWDGIVELSNQFSRASIKPIASPNQSLNEHAWWGEITGNVGEVLSLMYHIEKYDHTQFYSFAYTNQDEATALFYVIETTGVISDDN